MITFSTLCSLISFCLSLGGARYAPIGHNTLLSEVLPLSRRRRGYDALLGGIGRPTLGLPAGNGPAQLEEGDDTGRDRQPEGDHAVDEDRGEDRAVREGEKEKGADQSGVDGANAGRGEREQVGQHADEEALYDDSKRHRHPERLEGGPEDGDVRRPEPD